MKVSIRPPVVSCCNQSFEDGLFNIKFVSRFVDAVDKTENKENSKSQERNQPDADGKPKNKENSKNKQPDGVDKTKNAENYKSQESEQLDVVDKRENTKNSKSQRADQSLEASKHSYGQKRTVTYETDSRNTNKSSRPDTNSSILSSELRSSSDDENDIIYRRASNSNRRTSNISWSGGSNDEDLDYEEEYSQSVQPTTSSDDDDGENDRVQSLSDEQPEEQEILLLYGQIRQIVRGPAVNDPADIQLLPTAEAVDAAEGKETLCPLTVVTEPPPVVDPLSRSTDTDQCDERRKTATVTVQRGDVGKEDDDRKLPSQTVRYELVRPAVRAAWAGAATRQPYKTQSSDVFESKRLSSKRDTATPWPISELQIADRGGHDADNIVTETSSKNDAAFVVARRTPPLCSRGTLTEASSSSTNRCGNNNLRAASAADSASSSSLQQQKHHNTDSSLSRILPANMDSDELVIRALGAVIDQLERDVVVTDVAATSLPPPAKPCLSYSRVSGQSSTNPADNQQQRRRIHFAETVEQRKFV